MSGSASLIEKDLLSLKDGEFADFQRKLIPNIDPETVIGVRTPQLDLLAKKYCGTNEEREFLLSLPHRFFEENMLHCRFICREKDFASALSLTKAFLPFADNWAVCDTLRPRVFAKNTQALFPEIEKMLTSDHAMTRRVGIGLLLSYYLDGMFEPEQPLLAAESVTDDYYVGMMAAWYFATALAKQYDGVIGIIEGNILPQDVRKKAIRKALESFRVTEKHKEYLRTLRSR